MSPSAARSAPGASAARAAGTSARSRSRSSAPARSHSSPTSATGRSDVVEVILRQDVDSLGLRGDVVNVARGYARNFLLPRGLAQAATPGARARAREARPAAGPPRGEDRRRGEGDRRPDRRARARFDVNAGPTGSLFGSVTATNVADRLWDEAEDPRRPPQARDGHDQADRPLHRAGRRCSRTSTAELRLAVAPEGQELPSEEELAALEAAEAAPPQPRPRRRGGGSGERRARPKRSRSKRPRSRLTPTSGRGDGDAAGPDRPPEPAE